MYPSFTHGRNWCIQISMPDSTSYIPPQRVRAVVRRLGTELLVVNTAAGKAHCLNEIAGQIWLLCDGQNSVAKIARELSKKRAFPVDQSIVLLGLKRLRKARLLPASPLSPQEISVSRRKLLRTMGAAAALALPAVASMVVPLPAQAASCRPHLSPCTFNAQCCSRLCVGGLCVLD